MTVSELLARLSEFPPDAPVRLDLGGTDRAVHDAELIQGGWEPPVVRIVTRARESGNAGSASLLSTGSVVLLLIALLGFVLGYFAGRG